MLPTSTSVFGSPGTFNCLFDLCPLTLCYIGFVLVLGLQVLDQFNAISVSQRQINNHRIRQVSPD